jgi:hypothetical protein
MKRNEEAEQVVTHQPAISSSISFQHQFNRAGGRTSNVVQKNKTNENNPIRDTGRTRNARVR